MNANRHDARPVLVGIDDSPSGQAALDAAVNIARQEHAPLSLVRVWRDVDWFLSARVDQLPDLVEDERAEQAMFAGACTLARSADPELFVTGDLTPGSLYAVLLERCESARLLVLGTSRTDGRPGTIGTWCLEHVRCPVIVIGADGTTEASSDALTPARLVSHG